ncbi:MAG TPA: S-methyl-5'-thioadenosine phosphorylase [Candidatus Aminicenantes bacterium]|jgi:5'-methylthioadenosine phosphorylase|nr:S-methyl-5'-thioadenosine phosphorylase [Candidatus Aminicenantes bacterium]HPL14758.1 S-methyl-5'-thioadenosine phosphorylase [Candidatus Aminicenantes bacterium]HQF98960.1 S-methyl-5'-thioadenosine phosphorylase [Candidatus Aminicenantes bacterium]
MTPRKAVGKPVKATAKKSQAIRKKAAPRAEIGILGGTGLYEIEGIHNLEEVRLKTPWGDPSDEFILGTLEGRKVAFLSRHGRGHRFSPSEINYRANVYGFKMLGVERLISVNSVGSLREEIRPRDIVFADQFIDKTKRDCTFFGGGCVAHISLSEPVCPQLSRHCHVVAVGLGIRSHLGATYVCMEGPAFSTRAESKMHQVWGGDLIGMTAATEAKLFREAEICYATMNLATDYDTWRPHEEGVTVGMIFENLRVNIVKAKEIIRKAVAALPPHDETACSCRHVLAAAVVTAAKHVPAATRKKLALLVPEYRTGR